MNVAMKRLALAAVLALAACGGGSSSNDGSLRAPAIQTAVSQDGQATITWAGSAGASAYDLTWSSGAAVSPASGTKVAGVTSPYTLHGLTNGVTYQLVVTARSGSGEATSLPARVTPMTAPTALDAPASWWTKNTVFEHIFVAAFQDGDAPGTLATNGTGDLHGVTTAITSGYFTDLGVNALWLSPIFEASSLTAANGNKHGYDTTDYLNVASLFGSNQDLSELISAAHAKGIRVILDLVPNHSGNGHPWFVDAQSSLESPYRDWYVWNASATPSYPGGYPGQYWWSPTSASAVPGQVYYAWFGPGMPDLNYENPEVTAMMHGVARAWLDFGFDGMRVDAVRHLREGKAPSTDLDQASTHAWFDELRATVIDSYAGGAHPKMMMSEGWVTDATSAISWVKNPATGAPEFNVELDFIAPWTFINAIARRGGVSTAAAAVTTLANHMVTDASAMRAAGGSLGVFQSNHDLIASRPVTSYDGNGPQLYLAAALNFLGQGVPILYYGNEIAMPGSSNNGAGPDMNMRQPFDWAAQATQAATTDSIWKWHQALLHLRTGYGAWSDPGIAQLTTSDPGVFAYLISSSGTGKKAVVVANLAASGASCTVTLSTATSVTGLLGGTGSDTLASGKLSVTALPAYGVRAYAVDDATAVTYLDHDPVRSNYDPTLTQPPPSALYLRGPVTANGWGTCDGVNLMAATGTLYRLTTTLTAGTAYEFKFADASWGTYNYGPGNASWDPGKAQPSGSSSGSSGGNFAFTPGVTRAYTFNFKYGTSPTYWIE